MKNFSQSLLDKLCRNRQIFQGSNGYYFLCASLKKNEVWYNKEIQIIEDKFLYKRKFVLLLWSLLLDKVFLPYHIHDQTNVISPIKLHIFLTSPFQKTYYRKRLSVLIKCA